MADQNIKGKTVVITGATAGIGLAAACALAKQGARIIGVGRDPARCEAARKVIEQANPHAVVQFLRADLALQSAVRQLATAIGKTLTDWEAPGLDLLVNNAGMIASSLQRTPEGIERTLAVNHLAPFLLTHQLLPWLQAASQARVITTSSESHYRTWINPRRINNPLIYHVLWAYKVSKLENVLFTLEFNRRVNPTRAYAVDPGLVNTEIGLKGTGPFSRWIWELRRKGGTPAEVPARTIAYLASAEDLTAAPYWYNGAPKQPSRAARSPKTARELWAVSCQLCGITW
ncbi:MAG TPA: SDR family NAD(P)-dependent oxidoreductase [Anaerolineaceae bacterium]|nr:SDR family NAD(P)-dependent oxidoreductase [Anaerolineaceae bacterium]